MRRKISFHISIPKLRLSKKRALFLSTIAVLVGGMAAVYFAFMIQTIVIYGLSKGENLQGISSYYRKHIFLISEKEIEKKIQDSNAGIEHAEVTKKLPSSLLIKVYKNHPTAVLKVSDGYFTLSDNGRILAKGRENKEYLPLINYYQQFPFTAYKTGDIISFADIQKALAFIETLQTFPYKLDTIDIKGTNMIACNLIIGTLPSTILFSSEKDEKQQIYEAKMILSKFFEDKKSFKKLDLRFNRPVVEF